MKKALFLFLLLISLSLLTTACTNNEESKELTIQSDKLIAYLINDSRCLEENCDADFIQNLKMSLRQFFPMIEFEEYDYNSNLGKQFYEKYTLENLPAILLTFKIKEEGNYETIQNFVTEKDNLLDLKLGATFDPLTGNHSIEFCDNNKDDDGDGSSDCEDEKCKASLVCREEVAQQLDLFVMSQCPYGTKALDAMEEVLENFGEQIDFNIHYIANENADGSFQSLHGQPEVDENIRELCAIEYYSDDYEYMEYILCRNKNIAGDWEECAEGFSRINSCFNGSEGEKLLSDNIKLANELGIGASPTWIVNNRYEFGGIDAETVKQNLCLYNPDLGEACDLELSSNSEAAGACN